MKGVVDAGWASPQGELQPPPCSPSGRPDKLKGLQGWEDKSEATECSAQKRKERLCGLNWHILFLMKYCHLHLMQFMLKSWSCCAMGKDLRLKVLKHMFGFTPVSCPIETEDVLKIIELLSLGGWSLGVCRFMWVNRTVSFCRKQTLFHREIFFLPWI